MMPKRAPSIQITDSITLGGDRLVIFAGPCSIETEDLTMQVAESVKKMGADLDVDVIFKASYDKANRTSVGSYRSAGMQEGLRILQRVKDELECQSSPTSTSRPRFRPSPK